MTDVTEPWVTLTQNSLGSVIKAPKLTEKLLVKPPFRFLHDIVTAFMKTTGMLNGLYTDDELDSGKVSEKEAKIAFLQKLITVVQFATGETLLVKPTKVISGSEPEHTNALLAKLAAVASLPPGVVADAVAKTVGRVGGSPPSATAAPPAAAEGGDAKPGKGPSTLAQAKAAALEARRREEEATAAAAAPPPAAAELVRPGTATARKAPPPVRTNAVVEDRPLEASQPVAGVIVEKRAGATEADADGDDADDWRKVAERHETNRAAAAGLQAAEGEGARGYLARQAQEAKREQEEAVQRAARERLEGGGGASDGGIIIKMRKRADGQGAMGDSDIVKLREQLQLLTKASNPLGKFLEGIHEDVDTMLRELDMWRAEARTQRTAAREAQQQTQEALREVNSQLSTLDDQMSDQRQKVNIVRASIQRNEATIEKLIRMVVQPDKK